MILLGVFVLSSFRPVYCQSQLDNFDHFVNTLYQIENHFIEEKTTLDYLNEFITDVNQNYQLSLRIEREKKRLTIIDWLRNTTVVLESREWDKTFEMQLWQLCRLLKPHITPQLSKSIPDFEYSEFIGDLLISTIDKYGWALSKETEESFYTNRTNGIYTTRDSSGYYEVTSVRMNSNTWKNGLKKGDRVISIRGLGTSLIGHGYFTKLTLDSIGTFIPITVLRENERISLRLVIDQKVNLPNLEIDTSVIGHPQTVYIRIRLFDSKTVSQIIDLVSEEKPLRRNLILDLRSCVGGGYLSMKKTVNLFFNYGDTLWVSKSRKPYGGREKSFNHICLEPQTNKVDSIYILCDENTISGAEMFLIPFKYNGNGTIIGTQTVGQLMTWKHIPFQVNNTSYSVKVTTHEAFLPRDSKAEGVGIKPDIMIERKIDALQYTLETLIN